MEHGKQHPYLYFDRSWVGTFVKRLRHDEALQREWTGFVTQADELLKERDEFWKNKEHVHGEKGMEGGVSAETSRGQDEYYERK